MRFVFELLRDVSGLFGAALSAVAFFRFEGRKKEAAALDPEITRDPDLKKELERSQQTVIRLRVLSPNEVDWAFTAWGLVLIALSFAISIGLTLTEPDVSVSKPLPPATATGAPAPEHKP
jgi:hypothetical protein